MLLHGVTILTGGCCFQVSPLGHAFGGKRCPRHPYLRSEGFRTPPVPPLSVREREARCSGAVELWLSSSSL